MRANCLTLNCGKTFLLIFAATTLVGCGSKAVAPLQNISDAELAIKVAKENSATVNAPLEVRIAEEKLQKARETTRKEDFVSGRRLADEAFIDAKLAEVKSQTKKVKDMEKELRESIKILENEINRNQKKY